MFNSLLRKSVTEMKFKALRGPVFINTWLCKAFVFVSSQISVTLRCKIFLDCVALRLTIHRFLDGFKLIPINLVLLIVGILNIVIISKYFII